MFLRVPIFRFRGGIAGKGDSESEALCSVLSGTSIEQVSCCWELLAFGLPEGSVFLPSWVVHMGSVVGTAQSLRPVILRSFRRWVNSVSMENVYSPRGR